MDGEFKLKNGVRFATFGTWCGDGTYQDNSGNSYSVDAGLIGCILVSDIKDPKAEALLFGNIKDFNEPFTLLRRRKSGLEIHVLIQIQIMKIEKKKKAINLR